MRALRAIGAILRAAAGLDRQQGRDLDLVGVEMCAVHRLGLENQVIERQPVEREHFVLRPVVAARRALLLATGRFAVENHPLPLYIAMG